MKVDEFEKQLIEELNKMSNEDIIRFARLCALRTLPFIGAKGNFDYWVVKDRMKHLYSVFQFLEMIDSYLLNNYSTRPAWDIRRKTDFILIRISDKTSALAINAIWSATYVPHFADECIKKKHDNIFVVAYANSASTASYLATLIFWGEYEKMQRIILEDIKAIQKGQTVFNNHKGLFGHIWDIFLQALDKEGCSYWGHLLKEYLKTLFNWIRKHLKNG